MRQMESCIHAVNTECLVFAGTGEMVVVNETDKSLALKEHLSNGGWWDK